MSNPFTTSSYYARRIVDLGPLGCFAAAKRRIGHTLFVWRWRRLVHHTKLANHILHAHAQPSVQLSDLMDQLTNHRYHQLLWAHAPTKVQDPALLITQADQIVSGTMQLFGTTHSTDAWHIDDSSAASPGAWHTNFYADITIGNNMPTDCAATPGPDVKVPWERSRLQHATLLGYAYQYAHTHNDMARAMQYANTAKKLCQSWITQNTYLIGINWTCAMEVAIRAINLLWTAALIQDTVQTDQAWWRLLTQSLYQHLHYLTHHWETSDRPNNHYLADLLGALYLSCALRGPKHHATTSIANSFKVQMLQQTLDDGTSYENSTAYHRLVTEMTAHARLLDEIYNFDLGLAPLHTTMQRFVVDATMPDKQLIQIGDNDSGSIMLGLAPAYNLTPRVVQYPSFGIILAHNNQLSCSFRYPRYQPHQPSGHLHQDALSLCIWAGTRAVITDAGTGYYTAHAGWRNILRSAAAHSRTHIADSSHTPAELFSSKPEHGELSQFMTSDQTWTATAWTTENATATPHLWRNVTYAPTHISIHDWLEKCSGQTNQQQLTIRWLLAPGMQAHQKDAQHWLLADEQGVPIAVLISSIDLTTQPCTISPGYGQLQPGIVLVGSILDAQGIRTSIQLY